MLVASPRVARQTNSPDALLFSDVCPKGRQRSASRGVGGQPAQEGRAVNSNRAVTVPLIQVWIPKLCMTSVCPIRRGGERPAMRRSRRGGRDPALRYSLHREPECPEFAGATFGILRQEVLVELRRGDARTRKHG